MPELGQLINPRRIKLGPAQPLKIIRSIKRCNCSIGPHQLVADFLEQRPLMGWTNFQKPTDPFHHDGAGLPNGLGNQRNTAATACGSPAAHSFCARAGFPKSPPGKDQPRPPVARRWKLAGAGGLRPSGTVLFLAIGMKVFLGFVR